VLRSKCVGSTCLSMAGAASLFEVQKMVLGGQ
jgi:hypothetical protein